MKEYIIEGIFVVGFIGLLLSVIIGLQYATNSISCHKKYAAYEPEYTFWGGCKILQNGIKTPVEMVRIMD